MNIRKIIFLTLLLPSLAYADTIYLGATVGVCPLHGECEVQCGLDQVDLAFAPVDSTADGQSFKAQWTSKLKSGALGFVAHVEVWKYVSAKDGKVSYSLEENVANSKNPKGGADLMTDVDSLTEINPGALCGEMIISGGRRIFPMLSIEPQSATSLTVHKLF